MSDETEHPEANDDGKKDASETNDTDRDDDAEQLPGDKGDEEEDDSASVLFFGDHLENLVQSEQVSQATITTEREPTPMDSPSVLFFGESLEETAEREAVEGEEEGAGDTDDPGPADEGERTPNDDDL